MNLLQLLLSGMNGISGSSQQQGGFNERLPNGQSAMNPLGLLYSLFGMSPVLGYQSSSAKTPAPTNQNLMGLQSQTDFTQQQPQTANTNVSTFRPFIHDYGNQQNQNQNKEFRPFVHSTWG